MTNSIKFTEASQQILIKMLGENDSNTFELENDLLMEVNLLFKNKFNIHIAPVEVSFDRNRLSHKNRYTFEYYIDSNLNEITEYYSNGTCSIKSFIETIKILENFLTELF